MGKHIIVINDGRRKRMPRFLGGLILGASLGLTGPSALAGGEQRFCGGAVAQSVSSDLENVVGDMTMEYMSQQPASMMTCAMGYMLEKCGDHETAHKVFDKCIAAGYVGAMIWKALLYEEGAGVEQDFAKSAELMRQAAHSSDSNYATLGKLHYATALHLGRGVARDEDEALKWFRAAAAEGDPDAQEFLRTGHHTAGRDMEGRGVGPMPGQAPLNPPPQAEERISPQPVPQPVPRAAVGLGGRPSPDSVPQPRVAAPAPRPAATPDVAAESVRGQALEKMEPVETAGHALSLAGLAAVLAACFAAGALRQAMRPALHCTS